jgi:hypothetical protein
MAAADLAPLAGRLGDLDDVARKALVKPVRELSRSGEWGEPPRHLIKGLAVVGPAVLPDARSTAAWMRRFAAWGIDRSEMEFDRDGNRFERLTRTSRLITEVLLRRNPTWLPAVVSELADRLRYDAYSADAYLVIETLRTGVGLPPPAVPTFVAMWIRTAWRDPEVDPVALVRAEPAYAELVPLAFEADEAAGSLRHHDRLRRLADTGTVDRAALLDAALARLQRGGRPLATNEFVRDLESLGPTEDEIAARLRSYLVLLPLGSATSVASMAQRELLGLHGAGRLRPEQLLEMSQAVLVRTDKKVLRAQLTHLSAHARTSPVDSDLVARATCTALDNAAPDIQRDAVDLLVRLGPGLSPATVAAVVVAGDALPADLRQRLTTGLGADAAPATDPQVSALPRPPGPPAAVRPITSVDELVEELTAIIHSEPLTVRPADLDRVLEALPRLAGEDRDALRRAASSITEGATYQHYRKMPDLYELGLRRGLVVLLATSLADDWAPARSELYWRQLGAPGLAFCLRMLSLARTVRSDPRVRVVALPSVTTGSITAADLLTRLAAAASGGWEPDALDLEQALLRTDLSNAEPAPFAALGSAAGARAADWIAMGGHRLPQIVFERTTEYLATQNRSFEERLQGKPELSPTTHVIPAVDDPLEAGPLWSRLSSWAPSRGGLNAGWEPDAAFDCWPLTLPHQRELVAAHLLPELTRARNSRSQGLTALVALTEGDGPAGTALLVALAYAAAGKHQDAQSAAADGLIVLASRQQLDGAALGEILAWMVERGDIVAKRLVPPLGDAARGGAAVEIWAAITRVLAHLLVEAPKVAGIVDLLVLAAEVAPLAGATECIDGLDELAARTSRSRQVVEARRLRALLTASRRVVRT